ncbi:MAG TPA: hypothetical protein VK633_11530, partial [Verrucomicrobiae bacterium]|nr:hypothetical protein [Verrucomicrobiae bacterium]
ERPRRRIKKIDSGELSPTGRSIVAAEFDFAAALPGEDDFVRVDNVETPWHEPGISKFSFGDLAFAMPGAHIGSPGYFLGGHIFVARKFDGFNIIPFLGKADDLVEMPGIKPKPLARKVDRLRL